MELVLATHNIGKVEEFRRLLSCLHYIDILAMPDSLHLPPETQESFEANARVKAQYVAQQTGCLALGDDSGLVVPALGGAPGIYSARYAGERATSDDNIQKLLGAVSGKDRQAHFACVLILAAPDGREWKVEGCCQGEIAHAPQGKAGFGYDPIFFLPDLGRTMAELLPDEKDRVSHRGLAVAKLHPILLDLVGRNAQ